jgi:DNA-binding NarL/FixJ family response regulator
MGKKVVLVGHCGPDASYLRMVVGKSVAGVTVGMVDDSTALKAALEAGVDLVLLNRELGWGFDSQLGVDVIRALHKAYPNTKFMMVSNFPEAHAAAVAAGGLAGFGKRELGQPRVLELIRAALENQPAAATAASTATVVS